MFIDSAINREPVQTGKVFFVPPSSLMSLAGGEVSVTATEPMKNSPSEWSGVLKISQRQRQATDITDRHAQNSSRSSWFRHHPPHLILGDANWRGLEFSQYRNDRQVAEGHRTAVDFVFVPPHPLLITPMLLPETGWGASRVFAPLST